MPAGARPGWRCLWGCARTRRCLCRWWDTESYLPLAQHLNDYALAHIPDAPISPMRGLVGNPPAIGVTLGYSVLQGMTMLISGQTALATFAPLLALLRALGV